MTNDGTKLGAGHIESLTEKQEELITGIQQLIHTKNPRAIEHHRFQETRPSSVLLRTEHSLTALHQPPP
jgi:hypothetical protein